MQMIILGSGTSHGVPVIGCECEVCKSSDSKDKRNRCSAYVIFSDEQKLCEKDYRILVDCGPEFRLQALTHNIKRLDAVLLTHAHIDHCAGLDDLRVFSHTKSEDSFFENHECMKKTEKDGCMAISTSNANFGHTNSGLCVYGNSQALRSIRKNFSYIFEETQLGGGKPKLRLVDWAKLESTRESECVTEGKNVKKIEGARLSYKLFKDKSLNTYKELSIMPIPIMHGRLPCCGYLFCESDSSAVRSIVYLTDCSIVPDSSVDILKKIGGRIEHLVIDALRERQHPTHFSYSEALMLAEKIGARHTWFTHICHDKSHSQIREYCKQNLKNYPHLANIVQNGGSVEPAYDGLVLKT
ncbi:MAG: MBL fold metallo-hydrolase [Treponema sp.]|nr:MBL fold metallo-hydrolase [Treponema sp.]